MITTPHAENTVPACQADPACTWKQKVGILRFLETRAHGDHRASEGPLPSWKPGRAGMIYKLPGVLKSELK